MTFDFSQITEVRLGQCSHSTPEDGMCLMEMVSWFGGEAHSSFPKCASPVLGSLAMFTNDRIANHKKRDRLLKPFVARLVGTASPEHERARAEVILAHAEGFRGKSIYLDRLRYHIGRERFNAFKIGLAASDHFDSSRIGFAKRSIAALEAAIKAGPQGDFAHDPVERYEALKQLVSA